MGIASPAAIILNFKYQNKGSLDRYDVQDTFKLLAGALCPFEWSLRGKSIQELKTIQPNIKDISTLGDAYKAIDAYAPPEETLKVKAAVTFPVVYSIGIMAYASKKSYDYSQLNIAATYYLHNRLIQLATYIDTVKTIHSQLSTLEGAQNIPAFDVLSSYLDGSAPISDNAKQLLSMLDYSTFKGDTSFFTVTGRVLAAHKLMEQVKDELAPFFDAAGQLEAYYSVAKLYAQHQDTKAHYCFVEFTDSDKPYIQAQGFWESVY